MKPKILIEENIPYLLDSIKDSADCRTFRGREIDNSFLISEDFDALIVRSTTNVNQELLQNTNIRFVGTATSGIDHIDLNYVKSNNIYFSHALGSNSNSVAEYVIFSSLKWMINNNLRPNELKIGIIGYGNIGSKVANYSNRLGIKVYVNDPPLKEDGFKFPEFFNYAELNVLASECDIITNHIPLNSDSSFPTINLIDSGIAKLIKNSSLFIHSSRGGIVDEKSIIKRLSQNELTCVFDVWENEPDFNTSLADLCMIATPHIAGYSLDGKINGALVIIKDLIKFFSLKPDLTEIHLLQSGYAPINEEMYSDFEEIFKILQNNRLIDLDNQNFKNILGLSKSEKIKTFDSLRKNYPVRRESL